jgi:hypothetical protein
MVAGMSVPPPGPWNGGGSPFFILWRFSQSSSSIGSALNLRHSFDDYPTTMTKEGNKSGNGIYFN